MHGARELFARDDAVNCFVSSSHHSLQLLALLFVGLPVCILVIAAAVAHGLAATAQLKFDCAATSLLAARLALYERAPKESRSSRRRRSHCDVSATETAQSANCLIAVSENTACTLSSLS